MSDNKINYEGTLALNDSYRVIVISIGNKDRCFPVGPSGHPLARTGYASIDEAKQRIAEFRAAGRSPDIDRLPPTALPPQRRLPLEPLMDTVMRVEIRGIYIALLGIVLGGDAVMWILELPARHDSRASKIFIDEAAAIDAYETLCVELSTKYIATQLEDEPGADR
ncbi:MAG TPA: hypothetical protein VF275_02915 [Gammaproteobacteria bacterium]